MNDLSAMRCAAVLAVLSTECARQALPAVDAASAPDQSLAPDLATAPDSMQLVDVPDLAERPDVTTPSPPDSAAPSVDASTCDRFLTGGYCFDHTPACATDMECAGYNGCDPRVRRCRAWFFCSCKSDTDCAFGAVCITNERVCGQCMPPKRACTIDTDCPAGERCAGRSCVEICCP